MADVSALFGGPATESSSIAAFPAGDERELPSSAPNGSVAHTGDDASGLFGAPPAQATCSSGGASHPSKPVASELFGGAAQSHESASALFGSAPAQPASELFGGSSAPAQPAASELFGGGGAPTQPAASELFGGGGAPAQPAASELFGGGGAPAQPAASELFGGDGSMQSTVHDPAPQPAGDSVPDSVWTIGFTPEGYQYYYNTVTGEASWFQPEVR